MAILHSFWNKIKDNILDVHISSKFLLKKLEKNPDILKIKNLENIAHT